MWQPPSAEGDLKNEAAETEGEWTSSGQTTRTKQCVHDDSVSVGFTQLEQLNDKIVTWKKS